jgi:hypothetical protein
MIHDLLLVSILGCHGRSNASVAYPFSYKHNMENKELKEKMSNLYLDRYGPDGPPASGDGAGLGDGAAGGATTVAGAGDGPGNH